VPSLRGARPRGQNDTVSSPANKGSHNRRIEKLLSEAPCPLKLILYQAPVSCVAVHCTMWLKLGCHVPAGVTGVTPGGTSTA
jgi:hypothetical protein